MPPVLSNVGRTLVMNGTWSGSMESTSPVTEFTRTLGADSYVCMGCPNVTQNPLTSRMMNSRIP